MTLSPKDHDILRTLLESRVMTRSHVALIYFGGRREAAKKRVQKLLAANLVTEMVLGSNEPRVLLLSPAGIAALDAAGILAQYPSSSVASLLRRAVPGDKSIPHDCDVMSVKAAFHATGRVFDEFTTWPALHEFTVSVPGRHAVAVKPDGFFETVDTVKKRYDAFFLEVDRSTEPLQTLVSRLAAYAAFGRFGGFAKLRGGSDASPSEHPFRVLVIVRSEERRNNIAEALLRLTPPILGQVWLSTFNEACANPLSACWIRPLDYRLALSSIPAGCIPRTREYRRQTLRDRHVAAAIQKRRILDESKKKATPWPPEPHAVRHTLNSSTDRSVG